LGFALTDTEAIALFALMSLIAENEIKKVAPYSQIRKANWTAKTRDAWKRRLLSGSNPVRPRPKDC